jgi:hypothetical protein
MSSSIDDVQDFLSTIGKQGLINDNTISGRKTALAKFAAVLDENQKTVEYLASNIDVVKVRFQNLNKDVRGATVDEYAHRVLGSLSDFQEWSTDRGAWERKISAKGARSATADGSEKKPAKADRAKSAETFQSRPADGTRVVSIPIRPDFDVQLAVPKDLTIAEVRRLAFVLTGYTADFDPMKPVQPQLFLKADETNVGLN